MKLTKINYVSAVFIGASALVMSFIMGALLLISIKQNPTIIMAYAAQGVAVSTSKMQNLVYTPLLAGVVTYVFTLFMLLVYNTIAKKYPVSWNVGK